MNDTLHSFPATETERLMLRPLSGDDAGALRALTDDPVVAAAIPLFNQPFTLADAEALLDQWDGSRDVMIGVWRGTDSALTGVVGVHLRDGGELEIGYWFGSGFHGQGYASEAVSAVVDAARRHLPQWRIYAECRPANCGSWRVLEKVGFRATGEDGQRPGRKRLVL
jgi:RimJ/RimL family protein N-acetyltransferase